MDKYLKLGLAVIVPLLIIGILMIAAQLGFVYYVFLEPSIPRLKFIVIGYIVLQILWVAHKNLVVKPAAERI